MQVCDFIETFTQTCLELQVFYRKFYSIWIAVFSYMISLTILFWFNDLHLFNNYYGQEHLI